MLGAVQLMLKSLPEARQAFIKTTELNPNYAQAYLALGNISSMEKDNAAALENYVRAVELDSMLAKAYFAPALETLSACCGSLSKSSRD